MDRWQWVDAFRKADINTATLMNMSEEDFQKCCNFLIDSGLAPLSYLGKPKKSKEEEELDRIIEESNKIKAKKGSERGTSYHYDSGSTATNINDAKYDVNNAESISEQKKRKEEEERNKDLGPKNYVWSEDNVNEANQVIHDQQEDEYNRLLQEELARQEEENKKHVESMKQNIEEHNKEVKAINAKRAAFEKYELLGKEPKNGVQLALLLPSGHRLLRRFDVNNLAEDVFTVVEGQEEMYQKGVLQDYSIMYNFGQQLKREMTLSEQGIEKKTLLNVILE